MKDYNIKVEKDTAWMDAELHLVRCRLRYIRDVAEDFRENTSLGTIIRHYESRYKELLKLLETLQS